MKKYLLIIEFRYSDAPKHEDGCDSRNKKITIGVFDDFDDACIEGNKLMVNLESKFDLHVYPNGNGVAKKERFSKHGGCFGSSHTLITNLAYLKTPFDFYAKISTLHIDSVDETIEDVLNSVRKYRNYKNQEK